MSAEATVADGGTASQKSGPLAEEVLEEIEKLHEEEDMSERPIKNPQTIKEHLHNIMVHWRFEAFIVTLIVADLIITSIEMSLEYQFLCITPEVLPITREEIKGMMVKQETSFSSYDFDDNSNLSLAYANIWPTLQKEAVKGAMMLQIGTSSIAKIVGNITQPEEVAHGHSAEAKPEGHSAEAKPEAHGAEAHGAEAHGDEGHEHKYGHKTLVCEGPHGQRSHKLHSYCHVLGLLVLSTFIIELALKAWIDISRFVRHKLQMLDLVIVTISFLLDFLWPIFESRHPELMETKSDAVKVIILFTRLIRVVKVMHATSEVLHKAMHKYLELKKEIASKEKEISSKDDEITRLKEELKGAQGKN